MFVLSTNVLYYGIVVEPLGRGDRPGLVARSGVGVVEVCHALVRHAAIDLLGRREATCSHVRAVSVATAVLAYTAH